MNIDWQALWGSVSVSAIVQIAILYIVIYTILKYAKGSRVGQVLMGVGVLAAALFAFTFVFRFDVLSTIVRALLVYLAISTVVIFQPEIRRILSQVGAFGFLEKPTHAADGTATADYIISTLVSLSDRKIGALLAFERGISLRSHEQTGVLTDAGARRNSLHAAAAASRRRRHDPQRTACRRPLRLPRLEQSRAHHQRHAPPRRCRALGGDGCACHHHLRGDWRNFHRAQRATRALCGRPARPRARTVDREGPARRTQEQKLFCKDRRAPGAERTEEMNVLKNGNWGLKLLALILAIVIYYALKDGTYRSGQNNDRTLFQQR